MRKLCVWIHSHPIQAILGTFIALFVVSHFYLNWRAERRWQAYAEAARARGVKLLLTDFERPEIPDAENFAALPMMRAIFKTGVSPLELPAHGRPVQWPPNFGDARKGERIDWEKWQTYFKDAGFISETTDSPPRDVIRALEHYAPQFQEWSEWRTRPRCRFALDFKAGTFMPLPHFSSFQQAARLFSLRMRAHLALGDSEQAYSDFREGFQAYRALVDEPTLLAGLVRISILSILLDGIGDGLADHAWAESELGQIEADIATVRLWEDYLLSVSSERGFSNWYCDILESSPPWRRWQLWATSTGMGGLASSPTSILFACIPKRVYRDNQLRANQFFDESLARVSTDGTQFDPNAATPSAPENLSGLDNYYFFLFRAGSSVYEMIEKKFTNRQTVLDQTRLTIAIERFRMAHGSVPEALSELVPSFISELPRDIYTGQPMIYRRKESGGFLLYSIGPDRHDDGGAISPTASDIKQPDWVWLYSRD